MIGRRIKQLRKQKKLTQQEVAKLIGTSPGYISEIENGKKTPGGDLILSLKRIFNVTADWLLEGEITNSESGDFQENMFEIERTRVIKQFKNKHLALSLNKNAVALEAIAPDELEEINEMILLKLRKLKDKEDGLKNRKLAGK